MSEEPKYCPCKCHDGIAIICGCWTPCCKEPGQARAKLKPLPVYKIPEFKKVTPPQIKPEKP